MKKTKCTYEDIEKKKFVQLPTLSLRKKQFAPDPYMVCPSRSVIQYGHIGHSLRLKGSEFHAVASCRSEQVTYMACTKSESVTF